MKVHFNRVTLMREVQRVTYFLGIKTTSFSIHFFFLNSHACMAFDKYLLSKPPPATATRITIGRDSISITTLPH